MAIISGSGGKKKTAQGFGRLSPNDRKKHPTGWKSVKTGDTPSTPRLKPPRDTGAALAAARITEHKTWLGRAAHQVTNPKDMADARRPVRKKSYEVNKEELRAVAKKLHFNVSRAGGKTKGGASKGTVGRKKK